MQEIKKGIAKSITKEERDKLIEDSLLKGMKFSMNQISLYKSTEKWDKIVRNRSILIQMVLNRFIDDIALSRVIEEMSR